MSEKEHELVHPHAQIFLFRNEDLRKEPRAKVMEPGVGSAGWTSPAKATDSMLHQLRTIWETVEIEVMPKVK